MVPPTVGGCRKWALTPVWAIGRRGDIQRAAKESYQPAFRMNRVVLSLIAGSMWPRLSRNSESFPNRRNKLIYVIFCGNPKSESEFELPRGDANTSKPRHVRTNLVLSRLPLRSVPDLLNWWSHLKFTNTQLNLRRIHVFLRSAVKQNHFHLKTKLIRKITRQNWSISLSLVTSYSNYTSTRDVTNAVKTGPCQNWGAHDSNDPWRKICWTYLDFNFTFWYFEEVT